VGSRGGGWGVGVGGGMHLGVFLVDSVSRLGFEEDCRNVVKTLAQK